MPLMLRNRLLLPWMVLLLAFTAGCGDRAQAASQGGYTVVATTGMVGDIVRNVAGDLANVTDLMGQGVDPHLYKTTRNDIARLARADVVFYSGLLLEGRMDDVLKRLGDQKPVVAVTETIDPQYLLLPDGAGGHPDPHVWMDPLAWAQAVDVVADTLSAYDPPNTEVYRQNADAYKQQLTALDAYGKQVIGSIPQQGRVLVTSHDAFSYFGRAFDLEVQGVQGLSTESEAGLQRVNELVDMLVDRNVPAVFVESSVPRKSIESLIDGAKFRGRNVVVGGTLFSDAMGPLGQYEGTYIGMLDHNITVVARALGGEAPAGGMQGKLTAHE